MKFTHLITLKRKPWFTYATSQEDAINVCSKYKDDVVGVVFAPQGLIMQEVHVSIELKNPEPVLLDKIVETENEYIAKEILTEESNDDKSNQKMVETDVRS